MKKTKLIIHERFKGKQTLEDIFLSAFQSESYQLLQEKTLGIIDLTEQSYCRLSKDDEQAGESISIGTQKMKNQSCYQY